MAQAPTLHPALLSTQPGLGFDPLERPRRTARRPHQQACSLKELLPWERDLLADLLEAELARL